MQYIIFSVYIMMLASPYLYVGKTQTNK